MEDVQRCFPDTLDSPDDDALAESYAWPLQVQVRPVVRANMVVGLDGGLSVDGKSAGLGSSGDQRLFDIQRDLSDVLLVGAGTIRAEGYGGISLDEGRLARRRRWGLGAPPPVAVVTAGGLDADLGIFTAARTPPYVFTTAAGAARMAGYPATVIDAGTDAVDLDVLVRTLGELGLHRVQCEGGPGLLGRLLAAGLLDELCLTTSALTVGQDSPSLLGGTRLGRQVPWELLALHLEESNLFSRYRVAAR